jgi:hypothetical protein
VVSLVAPAVTAARMSQQKNRSNEKLQRIAQALEEYRAKHGAYPPAYKLGSDGKPWHSWRVLILPELGYPDLYKQYDMNAAWDSQQNQSLRSQMPEVFASPSDENALLAFETSYLVVVGPDTIFPAGGKTSTRESISDGPERTILVVEACESGISWMEPRDLSAGKMSYSINASTKDGIRSNHPDGASAVFADGRTHFLTNDLAPDLIEAFTTARKKDDSPVEMLDP